MPLFSRDDDSKQAQGKDVAPAEGPHAAAYQSGSLEGIPASGRQRTRLAVGPRWPTSALFPSPRYSGNRSGATRRNFGRKA